MSLKRPHCTRALKDVGVGRKVFWEKKNEQKHIHERILDAVSSAGEKESWGVMGQQRSWGSRSRRALNARIGTSFENCAEPLKEYRLGKANNTGWVLAEAH